VTGYLQRLVSTAVQEEAGVRPMVWSPTPWRGAEEPAWVESDADAALSLAPQTMPPGPSPVPGGPAHGGDRFRPSAGRTGDPPAPVPETIMPLFGATPAATRVADQAEARAADPGTPVPADGAERAVHPLVTRRSQRALGAGHASRPDHMRGTLAETARSGREAAALRPVPAALPQVSREPQHRAEHAESGRADLAGRDVEIHIGRIEVTAVSSPPAAPAPKAARKAINLDDYLRNGR